MKKTILFLSCLCLLTGCTKKVKCELTSDDGKQNSSAIGSFKKGFLIKTDSETIIKVSSASELEDMCELVKLSSRDFKSIVECKNRTVTVKSSNKEEKSQGMSKDEFIKEYTDKGYKCK